VNETWTSGTTIYHCPLSTCEWQYVLPEGDEWRDIQPPNPEALAGVEAGDFAAAIGRQRMCYVESILSAHAATHTTVEWITEINRLRGVAERPRELVTQWRGAAKSLKSTNAAWSSHFYDCANELERTLATADPATASGSR
jgi:hypothetical protein